MIDNETYRQASDALAAHNIENNTAAIRAYLLGRGVLASMEDEQHNGSIHVGKNKVIVYGPNAVPRVYDDDDDVEELRTGA